MLGTVACFPPALALGLSFNFGLILTFFLSGLSLNDSPKGVAACAFGEGLFLLHFTFSCFFFVYRHCHFQMTGFLYLLHILSFV